MNIGGSARCAGALGLALALGGCGQSGPSLDRARSEIVGGALAPDDTAVVSVVNIKAIRVCSGVLIAPNLVLTSRQCMGPLSFSGVDCATSKFDAPGPAGAVKVVKEASWISGSPPSDLSSASELIVDPASDDACGGDIALVVLTTPLTSAEAVPLAPRLDAEVTPGEAFTAIGYGHSSGTTFERKKVSGLAVSCVGASCSEPMAASEWAGDPILEVADAGGPAIAASGQVIGIATRANATTAVYSGVAARAEWIIATALHAANVGGYAAPAWAGGSSDAGTGGSAGSAGAAGAATGGGAAQSSGDDGGCSVASAPARAPAAPWALGFGLLAVLVRLRRRR